MFVYGNKFIFTDISLSDLLNFQLLVLVSASTIHHRLGSGLQAGFYLDVLFKSLGFGFNKGTLKHFGEYAYFLLAES